MEPLPRTGEPSLQWQLGFLHWRELEPRAGIRISQTLMRSIRRTSRILAEIRLKSRWVGVRVAQHFPQMTGAPMALQCSQGKRPAHEHQLQRGRQGSAPQKASPSRSLSETRRTEAARPGLRSSCVSQGVETKFWATESKACTLGPQELCYEGSQAILAGLEIRVWHRLAETAAVLALVVEP